jgi:excisionase family DNA binding protein
MDSLLDVQEVARMTGLAVGTIYHLVSERRIPVVRISRRCLRFRQSDLARWFDELTDAAKDRCWKRREAEASNSLTTDEITRRNRRNR